MHNSLQNLPSMETPLFKSGRVYLCRTTDEWVNAHKDLSSEAKFLDRGGAANTFISSQGGMSVYLLGVFDGKPSTLAHEAAHLVFDICNQVGVGIVDGGANETFCYLLDSIVEFAGPKIKSQH